MKYDCLPLLTVKDYCLEYGKFQGIVFVLLWTNVSIGIISSNLRVFERKYLLLTRLICHFGNLLISKDYSQSTFSNATFIQMSTD